jgi:hypothetical protein
LKLDSALQAVFQQHARQEAGRYSRNCLSLAALTEMLGQADLCLEGLATDYRAVLGRGRFFGLSHLRALIQLRTPLEYEYGDV